MSSVRTVDETDLFIPQQVRFKILQLKEEILPQSIEVKLNECRRTNHGLKLNLIFRSHLQHEASSAFFMISVINIYVLPV